MSLVHYSNESLGNVPPAIASQSPYLSFIQGISTCILSSLPVMHIQRHADQKRAPPQALTPISCSWFLKSELRKLNWLRGQDLNL